MSTPCEFSLEILNAPTVLPRVLLLFARRRLSVHGLQMKTQGEWARVNLRLNEECAAEAEQICRQLQRIVEVREVEVVRQPVERLANQELA